MKKITCIYLLLLLNTNHLLGQQLTGKELLDKAIAYHDPKNIWSTFNGTLHITMETPNASNRESDIQIHIPKEYFNLISKRDSTSKTYTLSKGVCIISKKDSIGIAKQTKKPKRSHCEMAELYKNYYTYLYGLPMKLQDPGTMINNKVEQKTFKGKDYLVLKVNYKADVGSDVWYFYFNPNTYAMEVYQFFKTDENGKIKPKSGEYILLTEEEIINDIKMPKIRAWYYNKDDKYLGTDILKLY
ncbi:DUF6503 family protein [Tamlana sp. 2201CG12-4]|uniref:DUF6503 family protein n=1 Tax=Tamlana sp. 2201CG12-4 TaxID=3112582 RepID=UPI002DB69E6F|nr:DUF6503 family protein [Tamlana sp. 2201CG12-4]MEC3905920.1 DUF6503 family protein [Tamlana sp. 2201CG12-4]